MDNVRDIFKKGCVELIVLCLLSEKDMYGREIVAEIMDRGEGNFSIQETSLYPTLYRLEDNGWISSTEKLVGRRRRRIYYHLEETGKKRLKGLKEHYYIIHGAVQQILSSVK